MENAAFWAIYTKQSFIWGKLPINKPETLWSVCLCLGYIPRFRRVFFIGSKWQFVLLSSSLRWQTLGAELQSAVQVWEQGPLRPREGGVSVSSRLHRTLLRGLVSGRDLRQGLPAEVQVWDGRVLRQGNRRVFVPGRIHWDFVSKRKQEDKIKKILFN